MPDERGAGFGCLIHKKLRGGEDSGMPQAGLRGKLVLQEGLQPLGLDPPSSSQEVLILDHDGFLVLGWRLWFLHMRSLPEEQIPRFRHYDSIISLVW